MSILRVIFSLLLSLILIVYINNCAYAASSSNIPLGSYIYDELERLELKGLIKTDLLSTKPFSRIEGARLIKEAIKESGSSEFKDSSGYQAILERLKKEFAKELKETNELVDFTPLDTAYLTLLGSNINPVIFSNNNNGEVYNEGANLKTGLETKATFYNSATILLAPEMQSNNYDTRFDFLNAYLLLDLWGIELEIGRDSQWWGSGKNGDILMTNNAFPQDMIKLTSTESFILPWIFKYLGQFKPVIFYTSLGTDNQAVPNTKLGGMRLDFKPFTWFQFGLSRTILFGGDGRPTMGLPQWWRAFIVNSQQQHFSSIFYDKEFASIDGAFTFSNLSLFLPFTGIKIYTDWGTDDSATGGLPLGWACMFGILIDEPLFIHGTDLRIEWGDTAQNLRYSGWYSASIYTTGYTYKSRVIGYPMGGDSENLYIRGQYHLDNGGILGLEFERIWNGVWQATTDTPYYENNLYRLSTIWISGDISYPILEYLTLQGGIGYERLSSDIATQNGLVIWTTMKILHI